MRRLVIVAAIPVLGVIAGLIVNAFVPQHYQSVTVVHLGLGGIAPRAQFRAADSDPSFLYADRILGQHDILALRANVLLRPSSRGVVIRAIVTGTPAAAEREASAVAHGYLRYLSCSWPWTGYCVPLPAGTSVRSYPTSLYAPYPEVPPPWVRFGLAGLAAGLLAGWLVQLVFLALGLVRLIARRIKGPARQLP